MKPFLTVIIPTLNEENFLPRLLIDLKKQKDKDFDIVIVDGNSEDGTKKVALSFSDLPISFISTHKRNVSWQRNYGAERAKGRYLFFIDADAGLKSNFTLSVKKSVIKHGGLVFIPYSMPNDDEGNEQQSKILFNFINFLVEFSQNLNKPFSSGGTMIWERNFFHLVGGFDESLFMGEDHSIIQKASKWGVRAKFLPNAKYKFSLRRMKKEGQLKLFYKYLLITAHILIKGDAKKQLFEYPMGGYGYENPAKKTSFNNQLKSSLKQIKKFFEDL
jgi:glycosyltransferase involved in cell wall biosynthesis